ncbi:MAG TPA: 50S ribosomal protein L13 [Dehalococcoidia bacterium]
MKTYALKASEIQKSWRVFDASQQPLGRLATQVANALRGKDKPTFSPHLDMGDFVIVTNAAKVMTTGQKVDQKLYRHHTGYFGGLKEVGMRRQMEKHPDRIVRDAVWGMLPKGRLGRKQIRHLKVYPGPDHPHEAQVNAGLGKSKTTRGAAKPAASEGTATE